MKTNPWDDFAHPFPDGLKANKPQTISELREIFALMEQEQIDEYNEYVKICGGKSISSIKP